MIYFIAFNANTYFVNIIDPMEEDFSKAKMYFMLPGMHLTLIGESGEGESKTREHHRA